MYLIIGIIIILVSVAAYQTMQQELVKTELEIIEQHYEFPKETLDHFMGTDDGEELREEIHKNKTPQLGF